MKFHLQTKKGATPRLPDAECSLLPGKTRGALTLLAP